MFVVNPIVRLPNVVSLAFSKIGRFYNYQKYRTNSFFI